MTPDTGKPQIPSPGLPHVSNNGNRPDALEDAASEEMHNADEVLSNLKLLTNEIHERKTEKLRLEKVVAERTKELEDANTELIYQNDEKENRAAELIIANKELAFQNDEKEKRAAELIIANKELVYQSKEKEKRADELIIANKELIYQSEEKEKRAAELIIANKELIYQSDEKEKRANELIIANKELIYQSEEKEKRAAELIIANKELIYQSDEKEKRANELIIANKELIYQSEEKEKRAAELIIANKELIYQSDEKEKRANELIIANKELVYQSAEKEKRAAELIIANKELIYQSEEKEKRAAELIIANKELIYQSEEKEKRAAELIIANKELVFQNEEREKRAIELSIANRELLAFTYISSHDMQEPLRKIQIFTSQILEKEFDVLSDAGKTNFNRITEAAKRMRALIDDLLAYSHSTMTEQKFKNTDLTIIVEEAKKDFSKDIKEKKAVIAYRELCTANVNPFQFRQVIDNLIGNALKFSRPGIAPVINIKSGIATGLEFENKHSILTPGLLSPGKRYCHICFSDNGIGFAPEYKEKIFEVFKRLHSKDDYAGTGIGLAIVKKIIENHSGFIIATGEVDKGATFDIYLPHPPELK